jgi:hypothetical protein
VIAKGVFLGALGPGMVLANKREPVLSLASFAAPTGSVRKGRPLSRCASRRPDRYLLPDLTPYCRSHASQALTASTDAGQISDSSKPRARTTGS